VEDGGAQDGAGALWIADRGGHRIRRASPAGVMSTVAGSGGATFADGVGTSASFYFPRGIALDAAGFAIVADEGNNRIRRVSPDGVAATLAGNGAYSYVDGFGSSASFRAPAAVAISPSTGTVFVADAQNFRVRSVSRAGLVATQLGSEFLPELNEGSIWVNVTLAPSVSPEEAQKAARAVRQALKSVPEVGSVISKVGRPDDGTDPKIFNSAEFFVEMKPEDQWRPDRTKAALIREMDGAIGVLPGLEPSFSQPIRDNVLESISQIDGQIVIKVQGDDFDTIKDIARQIRTRISSVAGVTRSFVDRDGRLPQFRIDIDRATAARYGVNVADLQEVVESALAGKATTELWEGERHFSVVVRLRPEQRDLPKLPDVLVGSASGAPIPLSQLVTFKMTEGAMNISRENGQRVAAIGVFIRDRDMGSVVADMQKLVDAEIKLPLGYSIAWSGEFENQQRAMARLSWVVPLSILLIFLLLFDAFGSLASAALIIANIPLAMIGGIVALWLTGIPLSVSAAIGFIALFGQAVLNGVVMVSDFNARAAGLTDFEAIRAAVREGALVRLRTVMMTALLAMLGLLPMALSHGIGAETQRPLAIVVIGGLVSATLLTLLALPALYLMLARRWPSSLASGDALPVH
jgi:cobalt-zinc-cadmium resistance protein CzcA